MKLFGQIAACVVACVLLLFLVVVGSDTIIKDRYCFESGGKVVDNVCMPVDGSIKFPHKE